MTANHRKRLNWITWLAAIALLASACSGAASSPQSNKSVESFSGAAPAEMPAADIAFEESRGSSTGFGGTDASLPEQIERIVIKNATLTIVVDDPSASMDRISALAEEMGGFVVNANLYQSFLESGVEVPRASITIRVPAERLDEALQRIESESDRPPQNKNISSQDVTSDYTDLQSRLRNLEDAEAQLREIMASATKTEDVLQVYNQLVQVREQIEVIKGQIQYYEESAALSSVSVDLLANEAVQPITIGGWEPVGVAKNAIEALIRALRFIAYAAIWLVIFVLPSLLVLYLIIILPLSLLWRAWRRRRAARKSSQSESKPEDGDQA